jgi:hypothetical protein
VHPKRLEPELIKKKEEIVPIEALLSILSPPSELA